MKNLLAQLALAAVAAQVPIAAMANDLPFPDSEYNYPGASATKPFTAVLPYEIFVMGQMRTANLQGRARSYDFGGDIPFVNPVTQAPDPYILQGWDGTQVVNYSNTTINNNGLPGRIEKRNGQLMVRILAGDHTVGSTGRDALMSYPLPTRTHARFEMEVAFGNDEPGNAWPMKAPEVYPVLFWQIKSGTSGTTPLAAVVDTDPADHSKLWIRVYRQAGIDSTNKLVGSYSGIVPGQMVKLVVEAFLDERELNAGGLGRVRATINNTVIGDLAGPTLAGGDGDHYYYNSSYSFRAVSNENDLKNNTWATFWNKSSVYIYPKPAQ